MEGRRQPWRLGARGRHWFDVGLATCLLVPVVVMPAAYGWLTTLLCAAEIVPLYWRRRHPVPVFAVVAGASALQAVLLDLPTWGQLAFPVALYSLARFDRAAAGVAGLAVGLAGALVGSYVWLAGFDALTLEAFSSYVLTVATIVVAAWALGTLGRTRQAYVDALEDRHARLLREAEQRAALAAADERARIAREMHDVVAHGLSVIVVQADGARYAAATDPAAAPAALGTIAATGREALTEMRRMLGVLRSGGADRDPGGAADGHVDGDGDGHLPQPRLGDLAGLVEEARAAGTPVAADLPTDDAAQEVPDGVGLTAYRLVQEALNNVRRHAGPGAAAEVRVGVRPGEVTVEVVDDGRGAAATSDGHGLGLLGMRERVAAHDGELEAGPRPGGGFRVWARIPA